MPYDCDECIRASHDRNRVGVPCNQHQLVQCTDFECNDIFHIQCIAQLRHITVEVFAEAHMLNFVCHRCSQQASLQTNHSWDSRRTPFPEKLIRFGLEESTTNRSRQTNRILKDAATAYLQLNRFPISSNLLDSAPKPYIPLVNMEPRFYEQHAVLGRRFEMSLFSFEVTKCHCCGVIKPQHQDLFFPNQLI